MTTADDYITLRFLHSRPLPRELIERLAREIAAG